MRQREKKMNPERDSLKCSCSLAGTRFCEVCESNPNKNSLRITSARSSEFISNVVLDGVKYHVQTEELGPKKPLIITSVFRNGEILSQKKIDYSELIGEAGLTHKLPAIMQRQHESVVKTLKAEKPRGGKIPSAYLEEVKSLLRENNHKAALKTLGDALTEHPLNPFLLSYYGCLDAIVNRNYARGVDTCREALKVLDQEVPFGQDVFYPVFYLNLGRAYLASGNKKSASEAFKKGLKADPEDAELLWEIRRLGTRKKPVIPFLKRSNPMNKYIGILLYKLNTG